MKAKCVWLCERCAQMIGYDFDIQLLNTAELTGGKPTNKKCCQECGQEKKYSNYYVIKCVRGRGGIKSGIYNDM